MSHLYRRIRSAVVPFASAGDLVRADLLDSEARKHADRATKPQEPLQDGVWVITDQPLPVEQKERHPVALNRAHVREIGSVPDEDVWERLIDALDQTGARYAIPHSTWTLPMANASGAKSMRLLPGTSYWHAHEALGTRKPQYPVLAYADAAPLLVGCALENTDAQNDTIAVADNCYVFLQGDQPCVPSPVWNRQAHDARMWIDEHRSTDPAVVLFTSNVGPWGGVACLLRVAERLCAYGINAQVLHFTTNKHRFNPGVGPIQVTRPHQLVKTLDAVTRADRGVLFATHWWGEELLTPIWRANPKWDRAAYWQDREDMFTNKKGEHTLTKVQAQKYAAVPNRVINATWVRDTAEKDLGIDESTVIPVGYDHTIFYPPSEGRSTTGPVRILAMYRPTTPRRGDKVLLSLYRDLRKHFRDDVYLEVFGEKPPMAADVDHYHGWLSETEVADAMRKAHIVIEPSEFQGFGLPGLEALATGAALVSTDNRGIHEYGEHDKNCLIAKNYSELFFHTAELVRNPALREHLGKNALEAAPRFSWPVIGAEWVCWLERFPCIAEAYRDSIAGAKEDLRAYRDRTQCVLGLSRYTSYP